MDLTFVELASSVFAVVDADDDDDVVDAAAFGVDPTSSDFVSFFAVLFTITTINFLSSTLYDAIVLSSANIKPTKNNGISTKISIFNHSLYVYVSNNFNRKAQRETPKYNTVYMIHEYASSFQLPSGTYIY